MYLEEYYYKKSCAWLLDKHLILEKKDTKSVNTPINLLISEEKLDKLINKQISLLVAEEISDIWELKLFVYRNFTKNKKYEMISLFFILFLSSLGSDSFKINFYDKRYLFTFKEEEVFEILPNFILIYLPASVSEYPKILTRVKSSNKIYVKWKLKNLFIFPEFEKLWELSNNPSDTLKIFRINLILKKNFYNFHFQETTLRLFKFPLINKPKNIKEINYKNVNI